MTDREFIPVNEPLLSGNEREYLLECIDTGWISSEGPFVGRFEQVLADRVGRQHGVAVTNGTSALDVSIESLGIGPGDEVILPAFTIISCVNQIVRAGATPVLVDSDPITWNMDVDHVEARISPRTRAVMAVHTYGLPVHLNPLLELTEHYGLALIEDAAEAIGQTYNGRPCGSFGRLSTFSFYANKHVTTGEGGMVVTDSETLAESCRSLRNLAFQDNRRFVHERLGWNMRMTNLQAAIGLAQLERLDEVIRRKREIGALYHDSLKDLEGLQLPLQETPYAKNSYWVFGLVLDPDRDMTASAVMHRLGQAGIGTRPFFYPLHHQPVMRKRGLFDKESYPTAEHLCRNGFYVPSGVALRDAQIVRVVDALRQVLN